MKNMRKLFAMVLAVIMVMSLATTAFAAEGDENETSYDITITHNNATQAHTYGAYQIFTGDLSGNVLSNIVWGTGVTTDGQEALQTKYGVTSAAALAEKLVTESDAKAFAEAVEDYLTTPTATSTTGDNKNYTITVDAAGYYLIKDTEAVTGHDSYTRYMMKVTNDTTASHKGTVPTVDKEIVGGTTTETGDYSIGDVIEYKLTGTLPSNYDEYEVYKYVFRDTLTAGLTYNNDAKVYVVNGESKTEVTGSFTTTYADNELTVSCDDLTAINIVTIDANSKIVVEYTCTLNSSAVVGGEGNPNTVVLDFSNDPNADGEGTTGTTPEDTVVVFTFELDVTKVDGANNEVKLQGAEFKLKNSDGKWVTVDANGKVTGWVAAEADGSVLTSDEKGFFKISGLEDGTYYLKETKAPDGYNLLANEITVVITSTYDEEGVKTLTIKVDNGVEESGNTSTGIVDTIVENNAGATLPETGGVGTTMFYVIGGILMAAAVVLLVTKKRMAAAE